MLRSTRPLSSGFWGASSLSRASVGPYRAISRQSTPTVSICKLETASSRAAPRIAPLILRTHYATKPPGNLQSGVNPEEEKKFGEQKLEAHPEAVSSESSVRHFVETSKQPEQQPVQDGIKHDLNIAKETFTLNIVPKESLYLGLAGTIPYLATGISTVYLSWALNTDWPSTSTFLNHILVSHDTARSWLSVVEPLQMGYGAVIISFLGAIHWGLEYAEKSPSFNRTRFRYGLGVVSSIVAWPTLFMPWHFALTSQFAAFVGLYFADARATTKGWAPHWYGAYRFVLTAIVGAAIMISLIGRAKIGDTAPRLSGLGEKFHQRSGEEPYNEKWEKEEEKERERQKKAAEEAKKKKEKEEAEKKKKEDAEKKKGAKAGGKEGDKKDDKKDGEKADKKDDEKADKKDGEKADKKDGEKDNKQEEQSGDKPEEKGQDQKQDSDDKTESKGEKEGGDDAKK